MGAGVHAWNPSYPGIRDQEDHGSKPARGNSSGAPILEKPHTKKGVMEHLLRKKENLPHLNIS
jgi:hypothetical protein